MIQRLHKLLLLFLFCILAGLKISAQTGGENQPPLSAPGLICVPGKEPVIITPTFHYGFIIAHHPEMQYLTKGHVQIGEVSIARPTHGHSYWNQLFKFPEPGLSLFVFDLGNPQNLGNLYSVCPYLDFPFNKGLNTRICLRAGGGMCYLTKPFDPVTNYKDIAIGSHFNGFVNIRLTIKQQLTPHLRMDMGISFSHCSNGAFKTPNPGLNMPTLCAGLGYSINPCPQPRQMDSLPKCDRQRFFGVTVAGAINQINPAGGHYYGGLIVSGSVYRRWSHKNLWNLGLEFFYNEANYQEIARSDSRVSRSKYIQPAAKIGYALCVGRISMPIELGFYFYDGVNGEPVWMYQHVGLRYQISERFLVGTELKTYFARAEFFEWGITYRFLNKRCS